MYFNFLTYYEQDMAKSKLVVSYYKNVYQGWHEQWWSMSIITQREKNLKVVITIEMVQERLCQLSNFGWSIPKYLYTLQKVPPKKNIAT
jgi:hypothetical protein